MWENTDFNIQNIRILFAFFVADFNMCALPVCMYLFLWSEDGIGSPVSGIIDDFKPQLKCLKLNPGPLQEQMFLTAELCLHPPMS